MNFSRICTQHTCVYSSRKTLFPSLPWWLNSCGRFTKWRQYGCMCLHRTAWFLTTWGLSSVGYGEIFRKRNNCVFYKISIDWLWVSLLRKWPLLSVRFLERSHREVTSVYPGESGTVDCDTSHVLALANCTTFISVFRKTLSLVFSGNEINFSFLMPMRGKKYIIHTLEVTHLTQKYSWVCII